MSFVISQRADSVQCKQCGYRLWNLRSRQCPECGSGFRVSDFEFVPGVVAFCCPHCDKAYYGMSATGHLIPTAFNCVQCKDAIDMESMVLRPAAGVDEERTQVGDIPWLKRREIGWWRGLYRTIRMSLFRPTALMKGAVGVEERNASWNFAAWTQLITMAIWIGCIFAFQMLMFAIIPGAGIGAAELIGILIGFTTMLAVMVLAVLVGILIWGLSIQLVLRLTTAEIQPISRTYRALCYSAGANVASIVPCIGYYVGWIWWVVSAVFMIRETHRISSGRSALAVIALPVVSIVSLVTLWAVFVIPFFMRMSTMAMTASGPAGFGIPGLVQEETQILLDASLDFSFEHGALPKHPVELRREDRLLGAHFVSSETMTTTPQVQWQGLKLSDLEGLTNRAVDKRIQAFVDKLPEGAIAHRAGDFIFTCPDADPSTLTPDVWLVIFSPSPAPGPPTQTWSGMTCVGRADGQVISIPTVSFLNSLQGQQTVRKKNGLPPLPLPSSITHAQPVVTSDE